MERVYNEIQKEEFKNRLKKIVGKKFDTTIFSAISQFEMAFGHLWGHGKNFDELTAEEAVYYEKWQSVRKNTLDAGNKQRRNACAEIDNHECIWKRHNAIFIPVNKGE